MTDATHFLMDGAPGDVDLPVIAARLAELQGVMDVHHVHGWALTSGRYVFLAHIRIEDQSDASERILDLAHRILKEEFGFFFSTLQVEQRCLDELTSAEIDSVVAQRR